MTSNTLGWTERTDTKWCIEQLEKLFSTTRIKVLDGTVECEFIDVSVEGEACTNFRQVDKILIYEFSIKAIWKGTCRDERQVFLADANGALNIPEFSSENWEDPQISFTYDCTHPASERINKAMRLEAQNKIRDMLKQFHHALKEH